jgi:hypothetical protein
LISGNVPGYEVQTLFTLPISIGAIISAIGAWKGSDKARKSLLVFVTLQVIIAINNFMLIYSGEFTFEEQMRYWPRVLRGFIYPAVYIWYFSKNTTKEFYNS